MSSFLDSWIEFIQGMGRVMSPMPATHPISITMNGFISFINYGARGVPTLPQGCGFVSIRIFVLVKGRCGLAAYPATTRRDALQDSFINKFSLD